MGWAGGSGGLGDVIGLIVEVCGKGFGWIGGSFGIEWVIGWG